MGLKLVIERECSRDHQTALRQFLCCEPGGPEWAMDPQRYIRDLSVRKTPKGIMRTLLVVSGDIPLHDDVVGFCEYGVAVETTDEHCFASMFVRQVRQCFSVVWADGFPRCRHRFPVM